MKPRLTYSPSLRTWCCHGDGITACAMPPPPNWGNHMPNAMRSWQKLSLVEAYKLWQTLHAERAMGLGYVPEGCGTVTYVAGAASASEAVKQALDQARDPASSYR